MQQAADTTGDPAQGCNHSHGSGEACGDHAKHEDGKPPSSNNTEGSGAATKPAPLPLPKFSVSRHVKYFLHNLKQLPQPYQAADTNRMTLVFFCVSALDIMGKLHGGDAVLAPEQKAHIIDWVYANQVVVPPSGQFRSHAGFIGGTFMGNPFKPRGSGDEAGGAVASEHVFGHIAMTYTALATLAMLGDDFGRVQRDDILFALSKLQREDGMFMSTVAGSEADMRFVYCAATICKMLGDSSTIDVERSVRYIAESQTYDGSFGLINEQEAHGGSTFCAVAALQLFGCMNRIERVDDLIEWCLSRQVGGFQGRRNKDPDTCYSFWVGATLNMLGKFDFVDNASNAMFHASCQFMYGGFSKFPSIYPDLLHSFFSVCFLAMKGHSGFLPINPALCISARANSVAPWVK